MCQLLGMNCNVPTDIVFSFRGFRRRAGITDEHADGFGIGFFEEKGCRVFIDDLAACRSPIAELVENNPIKSLNVIAHIRKATQGEIRLENCHPFQRELWGRYWLCAHNGDLKALPEGFGIGTRYTPVGDTDSEQAFCELLERLWRRFPTPPDTATLMPALAEEVRRIAGHGVYNLLLSNGDWLFAHCSTRLVYLVRQAPFATAHLVDEDLAIDFNTVTTPRDRVAVIATTPLTDNEPWTVLEPGDAVWFHDGQPHALPAIQEG